MVAIESPIADDQASRYEQPIPLSPLRQPPAPLPIARPRWLGFAEVLMLFVVVAEVNTLVYVDISMPDKFLGIGFGCALSLPPMLAVWSSIRSGVVRFFLAVFLAVLNSYLVVLGLGVEFSLAFVWLLASSVPVWFVLSTIKRNYGRFVSLKPGESRFLGGLRFGLRHLFIVTTLLAFLIPVGQFFWSMFPSDENYSASSAVFFLLSISALISFSTLMFVWALLGKRLVLRVCIAVPIAVLTLLVLNVGWRPDNDYILYYLISGLPLVLTFLLIAALRFSGYRFVREISDV